MIAKKRTADGWDRQAVQTKMMRYKMIVYQSERKVNADHY